MRNEEKPARRTRRSFLKKSAMAGVGAQSALIFSGLVMTSHASASNTSPCTTGYTAKPPLVVTFEGPAPNNKQITQTVDIQECFRSGALPCSPHNEVTCGKMLKVKRYNGPNNTLPIFEMDATDTAILVDVKVKCNPSVTGICLK